MTSNKQQQQEQQNKLRANEYSDGSHFNETLCKDDGGWWNISVPLALHLYLPLAGLALLWGKKDFFSRLLLQFDRKCIAVFCPSFSKRERLLRWAAGRLPTTWSSRTGTLSTGLAELWRDGSLLCILINTAVPEACPNPHRHFRKPPTHGQALAFKYLSVDPVFSNEELQSNLTISNERKFTKYLTNVQQAINKLVIQNELKTTTYSSDYMARGMGLFTGERNRKTTFYVYCTSATGKLEKVLINIRGPYGTYANEMIPKNSGTKRLERLLQREERKKLDYKSPAQKSLIGSLSRFMVSMSEDSNCAIPLEVLVEGERAKVTFIPKYVGIYQITLISNGELLRGSPFNVRITTSNCSLKEDLEEKFRRVERNCNVLQRKIISEIIDCIDEKIDAKSLLQNPQESEEKQKVAIFIEEPKENDEVDINQEDSLTSSIISEISCIAQDESSSKVEEPVASPICSHIEPEVEKRGLWQKRATLQRQEKVDDEFYPFSEPENGFELNQEIEETLRPFEEFDSGFSEVDVERPDKSEENKLIYEAIKEEIDKTDTRKLFNERKDYWNKLCSPNDKQAFGSTPDLSKSVQDVRHFFMSTRKALSCDFLNKSNTKIGKKLDFCYSVDKNLNDCSFPSVQDRKLLLLKNLTDEEKLEKSRSEYGHIKEIAEIKSLRKTLTLKRKWSKATFTENIEFKQISDRIKIFEKPLQQTSNQTKNTKLNIATELSNKTEKTEISPKNVNEFEITISKIRFKEAKDFFKSLEDKSLRKPPKSMKTEIKRKHSLDSHTGKVTKQTRKGGSFNLFNKYYLENLYKDVLGEKFRGAFKGAPNREALANTLNSISNEQSSKTESLDEDVSDFSIFLQKTKKRKNRRPIRSVFDVNY